jgi:stage II sporulation protein R
MQKKKKLPGQCLRAWEVGLLLALCVTGLWAMGSQAVQGRLSGQLVRLHVVANSDSNTDQAEKLQLRDKVLALLTPLLADCQSQEEAVAVIESQREALEALGDVSVWVGEEYYPTRVYNTFSLPAGSYVSLRITMGAGQGRNWWCVVFPPLCTEALAQESQDAFLSLSAGQTGLITQADQGYALGFRLVDWWGEISNYWGNRASS